MMLVRLHVLFTRVQRWRWCSRADCVCFVHTSLDQLPPSEKKYCVERSTRTCAKCCCTLSSSFSYSTSRRARMRRISIRAQVSSVSPLYRIRLPFAGASTLGGACRLPTDCSGLGVVCLRNQCRCSPQYKQVAKTDNAGAAYNVCEKRGCPLLLSDVCAVQCRTR